MRTWWLAALALTLVVAVPGVALAQPADTPPIPGQGPRPMMDKMRQADTNQDHKVTYEELKVVFPEITEARFKEMDTNKDGALSVADRPPRGLGAPGMGRGPMQGPGRFERLRAADKDGDKKVSAEEFKAAFPGAPAGAFARMDRNKDGVLTAEDRPEGGLVQRGGMGPDKERLKAADKDGDGKVTRDEFKGAFPHAPAPVFDRLDGDGDGFLTAADTPKEAPAAEAAKPKTSKPARPNAEDAQKYRERLKAADKDADGKITKEEYKAAFPMADEARFSKLDRNGDGVLTKEDRKQVDQ